jgi:hypothetical protein
MILCTKKNNDKAKTGLLACLAHVVRNLRYELFPLPLMRRRQ